MKKSKHSEQSNGEIKRVSGFLLLFILTLVIIVYSYFIETISSIYSLILNFELIFSFKLWLIILNTLFYTSLISCIIYTIFSLIRSKPNAISLVKITMVSIITSNTLFAIFSTSFSDQMESIILSLIWLLYFSFSKRVKNTFPPKLRKTYTFDKLLFFAILIILITSYIPDFFNYISSDSKVMIINESSLLKRPLAENEYSNGVIYFKKPSSLEIKEYSKEAIHSFILSKDEKMYIHIISDITNVSSEDYLDILYKRLYNNIYDNFRQEFQPKYTILTMDKGISTNGFKYIKKTITVESQGTIIIWSLIVISDNKTNKIAGIGYFVPQDQQEIYSIYLEEVITSIKFS